MAIIEGEERSSPATGDEPKVVMTETKEELEEDDSDFEAEDNRGGMKLRELEQTEYSWLKREHWW